MAEEEKEIENGILVSHSCEAGNEEIEDPMPAKASNSVKLRREGMTEGHADVSFDPEKRCNFHLDSLGRRAFHQVPEGFKFDQSGQLKPINKES